MQITCKWGQLDELITNNFIPVMPFFKIGKIIWRFIFFCSLLFPSLSTVGPPGAFSPSDPPWKGRVPHLRWAHQIFWCSSAVESSVLGTVGPRANFARGKTALPRADARNHARVQQVSSLSGWPQVPSGVPGSPLSLFSRGLAPVPPQNTSGFPLAEKNPQTHGALAGQDSGSTGDESRPCLKL